MKRIFISIITIILISTNMLAQVGGIIINEIMPANTSFLMDPTYNYGGWIELYNFNNRSINLAGYTLTDNPLYPAKYTLPEDIGTIEAGSYKVIFFENNEANHRQVNFKLDCDGATLYLYNRNLLLADQVEYGYSYPETSYARRTDGRQGEWATCITPTPGATNNNSEFSVKRLPKPVPVIQPGLYSEDVTLRLKNTTGTIHYTTDGSEPTRESEIWNGKLIIKTPTVIRFRAYEDGCIPSEILTCTYIIEKKRTITLPIISIVTDPKNLWDDTIGIYCVGTNGISGNGISYAANWNQDWRRPANVEFINNPHNQYHSQQCDINVGGGYSRAYNEKSLHLNAEKKYEGENFFKSRFFAQKPYFRFKSLNLRNSGNDFHSSMMADAVQQCMFANVVDVDYQAYQPAVHYINGEYFGIINIRERNNHQHACTNWGYDKENLDFITNSLSGGGSNGISIGDTKKLEKLLDYIDKAATDETYEEIRQILDIDEFINYVVIQSFIGNGDWMSNNVKFYRSRNNGLFRWILYDIDSGFGTLNYNQFTESSRSGLNNTNAYIGKIYQGLKKYKQFREKFVDHATAVIGGTIRQERCNAIIDSVVALIEDEIPYHLSRWSQNYNIHSRADKYITFAKMRPEIYNTQLAQEFSLGAPVKVSIVPNVKAPIYINGIEVPTGKFEGYMHLGRNYSIKVDEPYGYKFKEWSVISNVTPNAVNKKSQARKPNYYSKTFELVPERNNYVLRPIFTKVDSMHGFPTPAIRINEIAANKEMVQNDYFEKSDWVELYNLTDEPFNIGGLYISNDEKNPRLYRIPNNYPSKTIIKPHGYCILWADEDSNNRELHLPFKLPAAGGRLILSAYAENDSTLLWRDEIEYTSHDDDRSFGRYPDGSDKLHIIYRPTPATTNLFSTNNEFETIDTLTGYQLDDVKTSIENIKDEPAEIVNVTYYNILGNEVGSNIDNLPSGTYIRKTLFDNNKTVTEKIYKK